MIKSAEFRLATVDDRHLRTYDNTKLVAMNTCPTWGVLRYQMHKAMPGSGRAMALEAGTAMHDVFAWVRLMSWRNQQVNRLGRNFFDESFWYHGYRLFGEDRVKQAVASLSLNEDLIQQVNMSALSILETSNFYDDPSDRRRTMSNLEECTLAYIQRWRWDDTIWMRSDDPMGDIGIEIPFDLVVSILTEDEQTTEFRLTGKIDGIHVGSGGRIFLHENKTASRLNDAWLQSFAMSSQITGYCIAASTFTQQEVRNAIVHGLSIPLPRSYDYGGVIRELASRDNHNIERWIEWVLHTVQQYEKWIDDPYNAVKYSHSCNRYFRPCSLIPFCASEHSEQKYIVDQMVTEEWSPLTDKTGE